MGEYYDKMMSGVGETLDRIDKEKKDFKNAKVTDKLIEGEIKDAERKKR
jgi:hypothetical protein|tara:strand:- start:19 stop:165 length:147 start_codon:yes stop_codon:yes gene_type:complete